MEYPTLDSLKSIIAIGCLIALLISSSSVYYVSWFTEKLHEHEVFAAIQSKHYEKEDMDAIDALKGNEKNESKRLLKLSLTNKDILPEGYQWEEEGREFSYNGLFYDIVSIEKKGDLWEISAQSDEEESEMVAQNNARHKSMPLFKIAKIKWVYMQPSTFDQIKQFHPTLAFTLFQPPFFPNVFSLIVSEPPDLCIFS